MWQCGVPGGLWLPQKHGSMEADLTGGWPLWFLSTRLLASVETGLYHVLLGFPAKRTCHLPKDSGSYGGCEPWPLPATHVPILGSPCHHLSCCKFGVMGCCLLAGTSRLVPHSASYESLSAVLLFRIIPSPCLSQATDRLCPQVPHNLPAVLLGGCCLGVGTKVGSYKTGAGLPLLGTVLC